ncbi:hypothetical protein [Streptomyces chryseus]|uniref:Uncharacterized protein n=1 Tax=Streptomyces chryseus TaxID=68186 RepID=A0ABQ3EA48_9ACTN|nr:hypothetical protein [Streptomyces chryseus]GHB31334.1 hypothetical protein GCM10010346_63400 [Streptomyces chryseus]
MRAGGAAPGTGRVPARVREALRTLAEGAALASGPRRGLGWTITAAGVRLHTDTTSHSFNLREVADLQAALTAWLHTSNAPGPAVDESHRSGHLPA